VKPTACRVSDSATRAVHIGANCRNVWLSRHIGPTAPRSAFRSIPAAASPASTAQGCNPDEKNSPSISRPRSTKRSLSSLGNAGAIGHRWPEAQRRQGGKQGWSNLAWSGRVASNGYRLRPCDIAGPDNKERQQENLAVKLHRGSQITTPCWRDLRFSNAPPTPDGRH
jgi:hypothetical protein